MRDDDTVIRRFILSSVPSMCGWRSALRTWVNLLVFGLVVLAGTWTVHQAEYAIVYGHRFGTVMATTPHRFYMEPLGVLLAVGLLLSGLATLSILVARRIQVHRAHRRLPLRYARWLATPLPVVSHRTIGLTTALLLSLQTGIYLIQENLETLAVSSSLPGLAVLVAPQHWTVLPLQLLVAACGSLVLWTISRWLHRTQKTDRLRRVLLALFEARAHRPARAMASRNYLPSLRLRAGSLGLRSPPVPARNVIVSSMPPALVKAA